MRYSVLPQASKLQHLSKLALWSSPLWLSTWLALTIGGPRLDPSGAGGHLTLQVILSVTAWCVKRKGSTPGNVDVTVMSLGVISTLFVIVIRLPRKTLWPKGAFPPVMVKQLLRKTLWLKTTVLLWLRTSWWGVVWRLILALDLPTWWVPLCLLWVCRSECVWLYVGPNK